MPTQPVTDSVPKVNNELAVGADLEFQRRWWRFERGVWWVFFVIVILDVLGCFGRGPLANATLEAKDKSMSIQYERIERLGTPSLINIRFGGQAIRNGKLELSASESLVKELGNQRVVPEPASSLIGRGAILYSFPASTYPATVQFSLQPAQAGIAHLILQVPGCAPVKANIYVMP